MEIWINSNKKRLSLGNEHQMLIHAIFLISNQEKHFGRSKKPSFLSFSHIFPLA